MGFMSTNLEHSRFLLHAYAMARDEPKWSTTFESGIAVGTINLIVKRAEDEIRERMM